MAHAPRRIVLRVILGLLVVVASVAALACSSTPTATSGSAGAALPCDVDAVLVAGCQKCHSAPPQYGAPMPLVTYADLQAPAHSDPTKKVYELVETRIHDTAAPMPQPPNPLLDAADTATIDSWVAAGAPPSSTATCGATDAGLSVASVSLSCTPDEHLAPASAWAMPADTEDVYVCYGVNFGLTSKRQVIGMAPHVDNHSIVHHVVLYQSDTAVSSTPTACAPTAAAGWRIVYVWAPGGSPFNLPPEAGFPEDATTNYVVQVHYNNVNQLMNQSDSTGFDLCSTDQLRPNDADVLAFGTMSFTIPPHDGLDITCSIPVPKELAGAHVIAGFPHMHELGKSIDTSVYPGGGGTGIDLGGQPEWNFQSQIWFPLAQQVEEGDVVKTRCSWENTTDAPVGFGYDTADEMCYSFTMYYPKITAAKWVWAAPALKSTCAPTAQ